MSEEDVRFAEPLEATLQALAAGHRAIRAKDAEIRQLRAASRRQMKEIRTLLQRVQSAF